MSQCKHNKFLMKFVEGLNDTYIKGELMMNQTNGPGAQNHYSGALPNELSGYGI